MAGKIKWYAAVFMLLFAVGELLIAERTQHTHSIISGISCNVQKGIESNIFYFDALYEYTHQFGRMRAGIQTTSANTDGLVQAFVFPLNMRGHRIGAGMTYHVSGMYGIGIEHDLLASIEYCYTIPDRFILFVQSGYMHAWLRVPVSHAAKVSISNPSATFALQVTGIIKKEWHIGVGISSYEMFRYPLFAHPSFNATLDYHSKGILLPAGLHFGLSCTVRYSDFFTVSGYPENVIIRAITGISLQK